MTPKSQLPKATALKCALAISALWAAQAASAANVNVDATTSGTYTESGGSFISGYFVGRCNVCTPTGDFRAFVAFSLLGIEGPVTSATLRLSMPDIGYSSIDSSEGVGLFDVSTSLAALVGGTGGVGAFNDLGSGQSLGSTTLSSNSGGTLIDFSLSQNGINYINAALGSSVILGMAGTTLSSSGTLDENLFNNSTGNPDVTRQLMLVTSPVPEPSTLLSLSAGLALLISQMRRRLCQP